MKKRFILGLVLLMVLVVPMFVSAASQTYEIPKVGTKPVLDGKIGEGEWNGAFNQAVSLEDSAIKSNGWAVNYDNKVTTNAGEATAQTFVMWSDEGLYSAAIVKDPTKAVGKNAGEALNATDTVQLVLDPMNTKTEGVADAYIFDFVPVSGADTKGPAIWFEHWQYNDMDKTANVKVAGSLTADGYILEQLIPWSALKLNGETFEAKAGTKMGYGALLCDFDGAAVKDIIVTFGDQTNQIGNASKYDTIVLSSKVAGAKNVVPATAKNIDLPKSAQKPAIDGSFDATEWSAAYSEPVSLVDSAVNGDGWSVNFDAKKTTNDGQATAITYAMWDDDGFYSAAVVKDSTKPSGKNAGEALNSTDTIQLVLDPMNTKTEGVADAYIFDFVPSSGADLKGPAIWFEHWQYNDMDKNAGVKVAGKWTNDGYILEQFIPWSALKLNGEEFEAKVGTKMGYGALLCDFDGSAVKDIIVSFGDQTNQIGNASKFDTITLVDNSAATVDTTEVDTTTNETDTTTTEETKNPNTSDTSTVPYIILTVMAAVIVLSVTKRKKVTS